jgi:hypothetical protein
MGKIRENRSASVTAARKEFPMNRFLMSLAVVAALSVTVNAGEKSGNKSGGSNKNGSHNSHVEVLHSHVNTSNYHMTHGTKYSFGYVYKGQDHNHWQYRCWSDSCSCYCYYCPCTLVWYYWCAPDCCYYPVSHCPYGHYKF